MAGVWRNLVSQGEAVGRQQPAPRNHVRSRRARLGPVPPNVLLWNEVKHPVANLPWRLLDFMWNRDTATEYEVTHAVWLESADRVKTSTVSTTIGRANDALQTANVPGELGRKAGCVMWTRKDFGSHK